MTEAEEKLEAMHQMRTSMQILDSRDLPQTQKNKALENLFDAYPICHSEYHSNPSVDELKKSLIDSIALKTDEENLPQTLQKIQNLKELWNFSYFKPNDFLNDPFFSATLEKLSEQITALQQVNNHLEQIDANRIPVDSERITTLLNNASTITSNQKKAANEQNKTNSKQEELKKFIETAFAKRQKLPLDQVNITKIELQEIDGKPKLILTDDKQQTTTVPVMFTIKGKKPLFGGNIETEKNMKPLYTRLQKEKSITFSAPQPTQQVKNEQISTAQDFIDIKNRFTKSQAPDLKKETEAYNTLLSHSPKDAADLLQKLKDKYAAIAQEQEKEKILQEQEQIKRNIDSGVIVFEKGIKKVFDVLPTNHILALAAPASGQNQDMFQHRQHFAKVTNLLCQPNTLSTARQKMLTSLRKEETFWKDMNESYYPQIKKVAQDNFYQARAQQMFDGSKKPQEVLEEISVELSPDLAKKVLTRSAIVYGMGDANRTPDPQKTNEILKTFGYRIKLQEVKVESDNKLKSKLVTAIMRCLADGHPLDIATFNKYEQSLFRMQKQKLKNTFGKDKNYENLIDCVINDKPAQKPIAPTAYQKHNIEIGLLAALSPEFTNQIDFSEKIRRSLPETEQKQWNLDNYLFIKYMDLYFQQNISPTNNDLIEKLKKCYDWEGFKTKNKLASTQIYQDFTEINQPTETIIYNALMEGKVKGEQHHDNPLKYAPFSNDPLSYNNTLVASVQHELWQENPHQLHHLGTIEGTDMIPPYCIKTPNGYNRKPQCDLQKGDIVYYESLQILDKNGQYRDLIPEDAFYLSSSGCCISKPHLTQKALDFSHQNKQTVSLER